MLTSTLALVLLKVTGILVIALLAALALTRASAGVRHRLWLACIAVVLAAPAIGFWAPLRIAVLPAVAARATPAPPPNDIVPPGIVDGSSNSVLPGPTPRVDAQTSPASTRSRWMLSPLTMAAVLWAIVALAILALLARADLAVRRIVRRSAPLASADWTSLLYEICDRLGVIEPPRLARSAEVGMPFAWGLLRPIVVLPNDCDRWSVDRRRAVLLHELAHVRRRDLAGHGLSRLASAVWWFHPLVWTAAKRLRVESERACDDLALVHGAVAADYAEHLLDIVTSVRNRRMPVAALAMARPSEFEGRMLAILNPDCPRGERHRRRALAGTAALTLLALSLAAVSPEHRTEPAPSAPHVTARLTTSVHTTSTTVRQQTTPQHTTSSTSVAVRAPASRTLMATAPAPAKQAMVDSGASRAALLARVLRTDTSATIRRVAAWGLADFADQPAAAQALVAALRNDSNADVREMAAWALANARDGAEQEQALVNAVQHDADQRVRATAAWTLGDIGAKSAEPALAAALSDANPAVKERAVWALGTMGLDKAPRELIALLGDAEPRVRKLTAWALYNIQDESAVPALESALKNEKDPQLQVAYIRALAAGGDKAVDALSALVQSSDPRVRDVAVRALAGGRAGGPWPWPWPEPRPNP